MTTSAPVQLVEYDSDINAAAITRPFIARDANGEYWVVKARDNERCHLWRDFVGGRLALWLGLPCPEPVRPGRLSEELFNRLEEQGEAPDTYD